MTRYFTFVGVTTRMSSIMRIFPIWRHILEIGDDVEVEGCDLPLHAEPSRYRTVVETIKNDPAHVGGLVTAHKIDLFHAARDLFDSVDSYAEICGEVSCIAKRDGRLLGWAEIPSQEAGRLTGYWGRGTSAAPAATCSGRRLWRCPSSGSSTRPGRR